MTGCDTAGRTQAAVTGRLTGCTPDQTRCLYRPSALLCWLQLLCILGVQLSLAYLHPLSLAGNQALCETCTDWYLSR
jgi:hypothetical protein